MSSEKATGFAVLAGGVAEVAATFGLLVIVTSEVVGIVMLVRTSSRNHPIRTVVEIGDDAALTAAVEDAFPGSSLNVENNSGWFSLMMKQHGLLRPLSAAELFDGTLRHLLLIAALLTPRPPALILLNEPETSLHPDLIAPLARLIAQASERSQIIVVTHSMPLISALAQQGGCNSIML